jgi:outer membrane protein assembly factor BamB
MIRMNPACRIAVFAFILLAARVRAQAPDIQNQIEERRRPVALVNPVTLPTDRQMKKKLEGAADCIKEERWSEAVRVLQGILDAKEDAFIEPLRDGKSDDAAGRLVGARAEAERLLAGLPRKGMEFYRLRYEAKAREQLNAAKRLRDAEALAQTARRYAHTSAGAEALLLLAVHHLDRGRAETAAFCFQRLLQQAQTELPAQAFFQAALAFRRAGDARNEERAWQLLLDRLGNDGLRLGERLVSVEQLRQHLDAATRDRAGDDWPLFRGQPNRAGDAAAELPYLDPLWKADSARHEDSRRWLAHAAAKQTKYGLPILPGAVPLVVGGRVIVRSHGGIQALDWASGRELWHTVSPLSLDAAMANAGKKVQLNDWLWTYESQPSLLYENTALGLLSSDGQRAFAVEDIPVPPHPSTMMAVQETNRPLGPLQAAVYHNRLRALDVESGQVLWERGGRGDGRDSLHDGYFLGAPLPLAGKLHGLFEKRGEVRLVCLDAATGALDWSQTLAVAHDQILLNVGRRMRAAPPAYAGGLLICPTNVGAIVAVDPLHRTLVWAHLYRSRSVVSPTEGMGYDPGTLLASWWYCSPIIHGDKVICTAPDGEAMVCLNLRDGALHWRVERSEDDLYVAAVQAGRVLIVGRSGCRAVSLSDGTPLWHTATGLPAGHGAAHGNRYFLPLQSGAVCVVDMGSGRIIANTSAPGRDKPGNLVFHRGRMLSQSVMTIAAYPPLAERMAHLDVRLTAQPRDGSAQVERAVSRLNGGDLAGGIADLRAALAAGLPATSAIRARDQLYDALTRLLRQDFNAGTRYLDDYRALCSVTIPANASAAERARLRRVEANRQLDLQRLLAHGHRQQGRLTEALRILLELDGRDDRDEMRSTLEEPGLRARLDVWVRGQVADLLVRATAEQRQALDKEIEAEWQHARSTKDREGIVRFVALFGDSTDVGRQARLELAQRLMSEDVPGRALEAETHLLRLLETTSDVEIRAQAVEALARLLLRKGLPEDALAYFRRLDTEFGKTVIRDGKTGAELFSELTQDRRFLALFQPADPAWKGKRLRFQEPSERTAVEPIAQSLSLEPDRDPARVGTAFEPPPCWRGWRLLLDVANCRLLLMDAASGRVLWQRALDAARLGPGIGRVWASCAGQVRVRCPVRGHLMLAPLGTVVVAIDLLDRRLAWMRPIANVDWARDPMDFQLGRDGALEARSWRMPGLPLSRVAKTGPLTAGCVPLLTAKGIEGVDPLTGEELWTRGDVPVQADWRAEGEILYGSDDGRAFACRAADGVTAPAGHPFGRFASHAVCWLGATLLLADAEDERELLLRRYDVRNGKDLWQRRFPARSLVLRDDARLYTGAVDPAGKVTILDALAGRELLRAKVTAQHLNKITEVRLAADDERFYLLFGTGAAQDTPGFISIAASYLRPVPVNGMLYAFQRATGRLCWFNPVENQTLLLDQMERLPLLLFTGQRNSAPNPNGQEMQQALFSSMDKVTGKFIVHDRAIANGSDFLHALLVHPGAGTIDLVSASGAVLRHAAR